MAEEFKDGLEHLPLAERVALRAESLADLAAKVTGVDTGRSEVERRVAYLEARVGQLNTRLGDLRTEHVKAGESWDRQRTRMLDDLEHMEDENGRLRREVSRLRREVEFEARGERFDHDADTLDCTVPWCPGKFVGLGRWHSFKAHVEESHPELLATDYEERHRDCATAGGVCIEHIDEPGPGPQCAVHPDGDAA